MLAVVCIPKGRGLICAGMTSALRRAASGLAMFANASDRTMTSILRRSATIRRTIIFTSNMIQSRVAGRVASADARGQDRKRGVKGKSGSVRVDTGGSRFIKKKKKEEKE